MAQDSSLADFWDKRYQNEVMPWDCGGVPLEFAEFAQCQEKSARVLIPGCGTGYEMAWLAERGFAVDAIEFSPLAIEAARAAIGSLADQILFADFFSFKPPQTYDWVYERAFLCALPRKMWTPYAVQMANMVAAGGVLAGYFYLNETHRGPPFGASLDELCQLLSPHFVLKKQVLSSTDVEIFADFEYWLEWQKSS